MIEVERFVTPEELSNWTKETKMTIEVVAIAKQNDLQWILFYKILSHGTTK